jgi:peptidoglycan L-alanyl-D-glutamate endopeptidase CwlK
MLEWVHPELVAVCRLAVQILDCKVIDGLRTPEEQAINLARGVSKTKHSKHLTQADGYSHAVDLAPYVSGVDWKDTEMFCVLAGVMRAAAYQRGVTLRWGGDWDMDNQTDDERFRDYGHFELVLP